MIVFDTDVITLLTYGQTPKLKERIAGVPEDASLLPGEGVNAPWGIASLR